MFMGNYSEHPTDAELPDEHMHMHGGKGENIDVCEKCNQVYKTQILIKVTNVFLCTFARITKQQLNNS